ncbi:uncharacterized protein LOC119450615 [Dermacentor silvarum]|uniref:uncharacterized protein LOC119450615 n=1 Tax=Dermacentor silvarum TaxID=543639 RepID=UPI00189B65BE|nr:uncharacterized protein LOC119450615 [Dermacentor silvarum]XP_049522011.1 uncharacterized protein LOC119450615 [Dermacentor silvarum]XP_049522012.1 uncharacterized protein LOC119450615 [Dermacentor silvarum]
MMAGSKLTFLVFLCAVVLLPAIVHCRSIFNRDRRSGISDQRLAELETLAGLKSLRHRLKGITFPVAYGLVDPNKIGKRKRSFESLEDSQQAQPQSQQGRQAAATDASSSSSLYQNIVDDAALEDYLTGLPTPDVTAQRVRSPDQLLRI